MCPDQTPPEVAKGREVAVPNTYKRILLGNPLDTGSPGASAPQQDQSPGRLVVGCPVVGFLCHRRNHPRPLGGRRRRHLQLVVAHRSGDRRAPGRRRLSHRLTINAYPKGGGSYIVAKENLGTMPSLIVAAALLIDYTLTVAVSISAGVQNLASALPFMHGHYELFSLFFIIVLTVINLRYLRFGY